MFLLLILVVILHLVLRKWRLSVYRRVVLITICVVGVSCLLSFLCCVVVTTDTSRTITRWGLFLLRCSPEALILRRFLLTWGKLIIVRHLFLWCYSMIACIRSCCLWTTLDLFACIIIGCRGLWTLVILLHWTIVLWWVFRLSPRWLRGGPLVLADLLILPRSWILRLLQRRVLMIFVYAHGLLYLLSHLRNFHILWETLRLSNLLCWRLPLVAQSWECRLLAFDLVVVGWGESMIIINRSARPTGRFAL